jgi:outer membrane protein assembly factor BamE (lipoprotein component of BamABCDE complex)
MRRRKLLVVLAGLAVVVVVGTVVLWPRANRITRENFDRIEQGMSRSQVESILGLPGDYRTAPSAYAEVLPEYIPTRMEWWTDTLLIIIDFDAAGLAYEYHSLRLGGTVQQSPVANFIWRVKRQWHRWFPESAMRRRKLLLVLAGLAVAVAAGVVVLWPRPERITREDYDRIRPGMTRAEVEAILGPPGDYRNGPTYPDLPRPITLSWSGDPDSPSAYWLGDRGGIYVYRGDPDRVGEASFVEVQRVPQDPLDNLLWRAKRQWHRWFPE